MFCFVICLRCFPAVSKIRGTNNCVRVEGHERNVVFVMTAKDCGVLASPMNGSSVGSKTTYPNKITFSCDEGFTLKGSISRTCLSNGSWSGVQTVCQGTVMPSVSEKGCEVEREVLKFSVLLNGS